MVRKVPKRAGYSARHHPYFPGGIGGTTRTASRKKPMPLMRIMLSQHNLPQEGNCPEKEAAV
jgi:hypothetical protein